MSGDTLIRARGVSRSHRGGAVALRPTDIDVRAGETLAVVGRSGSGKSTLVRILLGLDRPTTGSVDRAGLAASAGRPAGRGGEDRAALRATGIVLQDPMASLDARMRVWRIVSEPLRGFRIPGDHRELAAEALGRVGLGREALDRRPDEFSGGQRQRIAIARAVVHRPALLVGDEPLSALDVLTRRGVLGLLDELRRDLGMTLALVSHDLGVVARVADRVVVLDDGAVVEDGPARSVLSAPAHEATRRLVAAAPRLPRS